MGSGKTTSFDIAHRAGVSQSTVSRALRDSPLVNPETRQRIQRIAREMNYRVDQRAAGLRSQRTNTLALLIFEDPITDEYQINPFFLSMLGHIIRCAAAREYDVLVSFQQLSTHWLHEYQSSNRADGIILLGYGDYGASADRLRKLREEGAHFTIWGATVPEMEGHAVGCENRSGGVLATEHLLSLGRRKIAFLGDHSDGYPEFRDRHFGYLDALAAAGLKPDKRLDAPALNRETSGLTAMRSLLDSGADFDAVFAASDLIAFGAIKCLRRAGIQVPEDVSVVGFDDMPAASFFSPSLSTVKQDTRMAAEALVGNVLDMIEGKAVSAPLLPLSLVVRRSCGAKKN
ncbi:MAG: LacI family DNA-binding transcriptional regulator [Xanthomonadales bacterium]|nr:LacI family DNA-binding transcriptional regulator [Xanthomonadales bacterium]